MPKFVAILVVILLFASIRALATPASTIKEPFSLRISCGARVDNHTKPTNTLWLKDFAYTGGIPGIAKGRSIITPPLSTLRYFPLSFGPENCYNIDHIPNGHYSLRVFFALVDPKLEPLFDISIQGTLFYSLRQGWSTIIDQSFASALLFVTDNSVSVCFHSTGHGDPSILSIEILQVDNNSYNFGPEWGKGTILRTVKRLSLGYGKLGFGADYDSHIFSGDRFWLGVQSLRLGYGRPRSVEESIKKTSAPPNFYPEKLYQSAIVGTDDMPDLLYTLNVDPSRKYSILLHFAEIDYSVNSVGQRILDIMINGVEEFKNVDIMQMTGGKFTALVLNRTVAVSSRTLTVSIHAVKGHAIINAIEIFEVISTESRTSTAEVRVLQTLKNALGLPDRFGWNGDPCVPQQHPWSGVDCQFDNETWVIDGLGLDNQGLKGALPTDISGLQHLQIINFSGNSIRGGIPSSIGTITALKTLDLSYNQLNGSIPESLGELKSLRRLNLNGNFLSGRVPGMLGGIPLHGASFNFSDNAGLCGILGLPSCGSHLSTGSKVGIAVGVSILCLLLVTCLLVWWIRRRNILRAQRVAAREAPYAKARTHFARDVQMSRLRANDNSRTTSESGPHLLSGH